MNWKSLQNISHIHSVDDERREISKNTYATIINFNPDYLFICAILAHITLTYLHYHTSCLHTHIKTQN